jgi:multisubunit Na+/H+ antiporter MnhG subunit
MLMLARIVRLITAVVVGVIVLGIVLHVLGANGSNAIVEVVYDVAGWLVTPFKGIFDLDEAKAQIAANWGLAAVVYAIVGGVVASLLARAAVGGGARGRRGVAY